ncbi:hypothetical protein [Nocardia sp. NPDC057227]|uniref:hypothetical protein n=1 Tax=Nocardia sp. NPDC057227 TaxID=3346056 RepID=UPI0036424776
MKLALRAGGVNPPESDDVPSRGAPKSRPRAVADPSDYGDLIGTSTRDVLEHFAKCPRCGYAVQASETVRIYSRSYTERILFRTCGLPCGWQEFLSSVSDTSPAPR